MAEQRDKASSSRCLYIPGRGQRNAEGAGAILRELGMDVHGPDLDLDFCSKPFGEQVAAVHGWLEKAASHPLVAKSYGAYLLLHAMLLLRSNEQAAYDSDMILLSPVTGSPPIQMTAQGITASRLPRNGALERAMESGEFSYPRHIFIHMGEDDPLMTPAEKFAEVGVEHCTLNRIPGKGHSLGREYESLALKEYIGSI